MQPMFHSFSGDIPAFPLPDKFTYPFCYTPHPLTEAAARQVEEYVGGRKDWQEELSQGKMFGVLVVADSKGRTGFLAAYSGNIAHENKHAYFVPPVYDLLNPDGFFRKEESEISAINRRMASLEGSAALREARARLKEAERREDAVIAAFVAEMKAAKRRRDLLRASAADGETIRRLTAESQFQKAELKRLNRHRIDVLEKAGEEVNAVVSEIERLAIERKQRSAALQRRLFDMFRIRNAAGEERGLCEIFQDERGELPPAGAGECAAPKLLQYAYLHGLRPLAMGEFWWGKSPVGKVRRHGSFYPSCKSKCEPILHFMLKGLEVEANPLECPTAGAEAVATVYEDDELWVIDKPAGMLSAPGKGGGISVAEIARQRFPHAEEPMLVHRLDMHTSGLLVVAKTAFAYRSLQRQFAGRKVEKRYIAVLEGSVAADEGEIALPLRPDFDRRPQQMVDFEYGKEAVTRFRVLRRSGGLTRVAFFPHTGRTHQLRVHAAHPSGLGIPIKGDMLYGTASDRLYLHAEYLAFVHPATLEKVEFMSKPPF